MKLWPAVTILLMGMTTLASGQSVRSGTSPSLTASAKPATPAPAARPATAAPKPTTAPAPTAEQAKLYNSLVALYMDGKWDDLETALKNTAAIAKLTKDQQADVTYIKTTLAECHPAWWNKTKTGQPLTFPVTLWGQTFQLHFKSGGTAISVQPSPTGRIYNISWPGEKMDNTMPGSLDDFTDGDDLSEAIWKMINNAHDVNDLFTVQKVANITPEQDKKFLRYIEFRGVLAGAYYGTPEARNHIFCLCIGAYETHNLQNPRFLPRRPLGSALLIEMVGHPERYPSFKIPRDLKHIAGGTDNDEIAIWAEPLYHQFEDVKYTLAEDKAFRAMIKSLATANGDVKAALNNDVVKLAENLACSLDLPADVPFLNARTRWLEEHVAAMK